MTYVYWFVTPTRNLIYEFPRNPTSQIWIKHRTKASLEILISRNEFIKKHQIHYYDFLPPFILVIVNGHTGLLCLFQHLEGEKPYNVPDHSQFYILSEKSTYQRQLLTELQYWFNNTFENLSYNSSRPDQKPNRPYPVVYKNWHDPSIQDALRKATRSISVIDSWVTNPVDILDPVRDACVNVSEHPHIRYIHARS